MGLGRRTRGTDGVEQITFAECLNKIVEWGGVARIYGYPRKGEGRNNRVYMVTAESRLQNGKNGEFFCATRMKYDRSEKRYVPDDEKAHIIRSIDVQYVTPRLSGEVNGTWIRVCD